jgi:hypothetical protein
VLKIPEDGVGAATINCLPREHPVSRDSPAVQRSIAI